MDGSFDKVDDLKAEIEKLKIECNTKEELFKSLKRANGELLLESKGAKMLIEQKSKELEAKTEEISEVRQICENLNSSLKEKESSVKHLNSVNEKLRVEYNEKIKLLEEQNKGLVVALDEATLRIQDCDVKLCAGDNEIQGLRRLLATAEKKCLGAEEKTKASKELKCRENIITEVEEENRSVRDQLKWKSEQFEHLEQAHELLQNQFHRSKVEWEKEKSDLLKDLFLLKTSLDSQTEISEDLRTQLKMCNQALSHEESKRKILEMKVVELNSRFENVALEFEEARSKIENLTLLRDDDIADLRCELATKEAVNKEMKYKIAHLELENDELQGLLKECREEQIKLAGGLPVKKLQNKLRSLEKLHGQCSMNLEKKEAEWNSRYETMLEVVNGNMSDLKNKEVKIQDLQKKLECCSYLMEFQNQDAKIMLSEIAEMCLENKELGRLSDDRTANPKNYGMHTGISEELLKCQDRLKEQFEEMETTLRRSSEGIVYALEIANCKLAKKVNEVNQTKLEIQKWKSSAEMVRTDIEENHQILMREKDSLVRLMKEQDVKIGNLQNQVALFDANITAKMEDIKALEQEKKHYYQIVENNYSNIRELKSEIALLKHEYAEKEGEASMQACFDAQLISKQEEERFLKVIKEQDQTIEDLKRWIMMIEQHYERQLMSSFSAITEKDIQLDSLVETVGQVEKLKQLEIQDKNQAIGELEKGIQNSLHELFSLKESLLHSSSQVAELTAELEAQKWETAQEKNQCSSKQVQVLELQCEKENLLGELMNMCSQRKDMVAQMEAAYDWIKELSCKDAELTNTLENILQNTENNFGQAIHSIGDELVQTHLSPSIKSERERCNQRSPLKVLND